MVLYGDVKRYGRAGNPSEPARTGECAIAIDASITTSAITKIDGDKGLVYTKSGSVYQLVGPPRPMIFSAAPENWQTRLDINGKLSSFVLQQLSNASSHEREALQIAHTNFLFIGV